MICKKCGVDGISHGTNNITKILENGDFTILAWKDHMTVLMNKYKKLRWRQQHKSNV